jgi:hypothetical protein
VAAGQAQDKVGGDLAEAVAGPPVVNLRARSVVRAGIGGRQVPGAHRQDSGRELPQRDPAGQEFPPGCQVRDAGGTRAFRRVKEVLTARPDVGKPNGPDGDSGYGESSPVLPLL